MTLTRRRNLPGFCTIAQQISLPPQHTFRSIQHEGGIEMTMQECCVLVTGVFLRRVYIISRAVAPAKHRDIPVGFQRENGLFVNLNYRESYKTISLLPSWRGAAVLPGTKHHLMRQSHPRASIPLLLRGLLLPPQHPFNLKFMLAGSQRRARVFCFCNWCFVQGGYI